MLFILAGLGRHIRKAYLAVTTFSLLSVSLYVTKQERFQQEALAPR